MIMNYRDSGISNVVVPVFHDTSREKINKAYIHMAKYV